MEQGTVKSKRVRHVIKRAVWARPRQSQTPTVTCEKRDESNMVFGRVVVEEHA